MRASESLPAAYGFAAGAAAPKENGLRWESRGSPIYSAGLCSRAASHTPATRRVRLTVSSSSVLAFTPVSRVRRHNWKFRGCRVHSFPSPQELLRPASWLALLSRTFTFAIRQRIANLFPPAHRLAFVASDRHRIAKIGGGANTVRDTWALVCSRPSAVCVLASATVTPRESSRIAEKTRDALPGHRPPASTTRDPPDR